MLTHAIEATTYEGDIVLDCFAGSGSTQIAALKANRRSISIELDPIWAERNVAITDNKDELALLGRRIKKTINNEHYQFEL